VFFFAMRRRHDIPHSKERLKRKRKQAAVNVVLVAITVFLLVGATAWVSARPHIRIATITVHGTSILRSDEITSFVRHEMDGKYFFLFPKDNVFFYPKKTIAHDLLASFKRIRSVEISSDGFTALSVSITERAPYSLWCGITAPTVSGNTETCYFTDQEGFIFAEAPRFSDNVYLKFYGPLVGAATTTAAPPIGSSFLTAEQFRKINLFRDLLDRVHVKIYRASAIGEGDFGFAMDGGGTIFFNVSQDPVRLASDFESAYRAELGDPGDQNLRAHLMYVDLRFAGKVFFKKNGS
jgi:hypothetical protein